MNMDVPRAPKPNELDQLWEFLDKNLRPKAGWNLIQEYPTTLNAKNAHNLRMVVENSEILSHAALRTLVVKSPQIALKVGAIGSVVTREESRHQGHGRKIIESLVQLAEVQECDIAVLWTNQFAFYEKLGFTLAGFEHSGFVNWEVVDTSPNRVQVGPLVDANAILRLYNRHTLGAYRTAEEISKYLRIPNSRIYTLWAPNHQMLAYAVEGKGADLVNYVHEWGGDVASVRDLLGWMAHERRAKSSGCKPDENPLLVFMSFANSQLHRIFDSENLHTGFFGMVKILDPQKLLNRVAKICGIQAEKRNPGWLIRVPGAAQDSQWELQSESELVTFLFGSPKVSFANLPKALPIPLWIWGWDSV